MDHTGKEYRGVHGKYRIDKHLGGGGMGVVYEATDSNGQSVVIKFAADKDPAKPTMYNPAKCAEAARKLKEESEFLKELTNMNAPNIVKYIDESKNSNNFFFVMEKINGKSLTQKMKSFSTGITDPNALSKYSQNLLRALEYIHKQGIVYRDLKPDNIMVEEKTERLVLLDFGGATKKDMQVTSMVTDNSVMGTERWICPHQRDDQSSKKCDLYSFGKILSFMASGKPPPRIGMPQKLHILKPGINPNLVTLVDEILDEDHKTIISASQLATKIKSLPTSAPKPPPKRIGKTAVAVQTQSNQHKEARIMLNGTEHKIPLDQAGLIIGKYHDDRICKANNAGCNSIHGENIFVGWNCPDMCRCDSNPAHMIEKHHMKIMMSIDGKFYIVNNDQYRRSAIYRHGKWSPVTYSHPTQIQHNDKVALLYNDQRGPFETFVFYRR